MISSYKSNYGIGFNNTEIFSINDKTPYKLEEDKYGKYIDILLSIDQTSEINKVVKSLVSYIRHKDHIIKSFTDPIKIIDNDFVLRIRKITNQKPGKFGKFQLLSSAFLNNKKILSLSFKIKLMKEYN